MPNKNPQALVKEEAKPEMQLFREFEHAMLDMERRLDRVVRDTFGDQELPFPLLHGLSLTKAPDGKLRFQPFGNLQESVDKLLEGWREPVLTWNIGEGGRTLVFHAEVPGLKKEDLKVKILRDGLHIEGESKSKDAGTRRYRADCKPGYTLDPNACEARYDDGVLTVSCRLVEPDGAKGRDLQVR